MVGIQYEQLALHTDIHILSGNSFQVIGHIELDTTDAGRITVWYGEDGIHLSHGTSARYDKSAQVISWEGAAERIGELLESGQFASNVELAEAEGYERSLLANKLWNLYHD
ncbi:MAG: hypothetical protein HFF76_10845, partial [Oscillospiraceae bacterium]|nr:hypothetical protein [Oscillospiraceae bacterium]